jgi:hypothetical protein
LTINGEYWQRSLYSISCSLDEYTSRIPEAPFGEKHNSYYRIAMRKMLNLTQERTLMSAIIPPQTSHVLGVFSIAFYDNYDLLTFSGESFSIPIDFLVKITGKSNILRDTTGKLPLLKKSVITDEIIARTLLLNCLTTPYSAIWKQGEKYRNFAWSKHDARISNEAFQRLSKDWTTSSPLRSEYERRQALIEIDVLVAWRSV